MSTLKVSFGGLHQAAIHSCQELEWQQVCALFTRRPAVLVDKAGAGWYCPAAFMPSYRDSDNFVARYALTLDFDHVPDSAWEAVADAWASLAYVAYTTWSHRQAGKGLRFRVVMPLSRGATYDEYQAVVRKVAADLDIEWAARESFVPAQFMYLPAVASADAEYLCHVNDGEFLDVDAVLAEYRDWTDHTQWPKRLTGDGVHSIIAEQTAPTDKPGIIGEFCRAFDVPAAIQRFELPYVPARVEGRWTYTAGSRPEGAIVYDGGQKLHSHHDTDPARGQSNSFDLVRLHRFGNLDKPADLGLVVAQRPSFAAMCTFAREQPELVKVRAESEFTDLGPAPETSLNEFTNLGPLTPDQSPDKVGMAASLARRLADVLSTPTAPDWLIEDVLERYVIAILAGPRGSYKSFVVLDWTMQVVTRPNAEPVYVISGEGGDFDRRSAAWLRHFRPDVKPTDIPLFIVERRLDLSSKEGIELIRQDCVRLGIRPSLFVLDTFSKLSGGLEENDNTAVKAFVGRLDNGLKRPDTGFGATVLIVAHTGHGDSTRARGASALAADTDAEYIASRTDEGVGISRQRFKSSPELPPLFYKPRIVELGRVDKQNRPITSLVMLASEPPMNRATKKAPTTPAQKIAIRVLQDMAPHGESVSTYDLVKGIAKQLTATSSDTSRDRRKEQAARAVDQLVAIGVFHSHPGERVSNTPLNVGSDEEFE